MQAYLIENKGWRDLWVRGHQGHTEVIVPGQKKVCEDVLAVELGEQGLHRFSVEPVGK